MSGHHLFAVQVLLEIGATPSLREKLFQLVRTAPAASQYDERRAFWATVQALLHPARHRFAMGVWDYVDDVERAESELTDWREGTIADAREAAQREADPYRDGRRYMFVTALFQVGRGGAADRAIADHVVIDESTYWLRETFDAHFALLPKLNFATVRSDALFVRPREESLAVTDSELAEESYAYLKKLT